jgi:NAD(P)-dependent dehydrogenase (short-subunit alcohol dehydrogenase family)
MGTLPTLLERMGLSRSSLAGKVVIVTGAGQGIGKELSRALAWLGANVIIAEIRDTGAAVEQLIRSEGGTALFVKTDVSDEQNMEALARTAFMHFKKVDILVNNAAVEPIGSTVELPLADWDRTYAVNVRGAVLGIKAFLPGMLERGEGTITTVASVEGLAYMGAYAASKVAVQSLCLSLAAELGDTSGMSAFVLAPGMVDTPGFREALPDIAPRYGMTPDEFMHQGVNPGYDGLMPAGDCAAGFAYAIVNAKEYHGQIADPFAPLMKFGLLPAATATLEPITAQPERPRTAETPSETPPTYEEARTYAKELKELLEATNSEFQQVSPFARTWALRDFHKKANMTMQDWLHTSAALVTQLEEYDDAVQSGDTQSAQRIRGQFRHVVPLLTKLAEYFRSTHDGVTHFIKEPEALAEARETLAYRERIARLLKVTLERIVL